MTLKLKSYRMIASWWSCWLFVLAASWLTSGVDAELGGVFRSRMIRGFDDFQDELVPDQELGHEIEQVYRDIFKQAGQNKDDLLEHDGLLDWCDRSQESSNICNSAQIGLEAFKKLLSKSEKVKSFQSSSKLKLPSLVCPRLARPTVCDSTTQFRTYNGSCNNLEHTWWGQSESPYKRLLPSLYDDQVDEPRVKSKCSEYLPNSRRVASHVFKHTPGIDDELISDRTLLLAHFGHFVHNDLSHIAQSTDQTGYRKICKCRSHEVDCFNIPIPNDDTINQDQECMSYVRSFVSAREFDCSLGPREQLNLASAWLDLSQVYGSNEEKALALRTLSNGTLKSQIDPVSGEILSQSIEDCDQSQQAVEYSRRVKCLISGDSRTEDDVWLTSLTTLWLREHNRIARVLSQFNSHWSDEKVYQTTRRIVIAEYQNIVYSEYLPALLGKHLSELFDLPSYENGYFNRHQADLYPQILNEYTAGCGPIWQAFFNSKQSMADPDLFKIYDKPISFFLFNNNHYKRSINETLRGSLIDPTLGLGRLSINNYLNDWYWNDMYSNDSKRWSSPALDIQRGRDHGLPGYNKYRKAVGLSEAKSFDEFKNIDKWALKKLKSVYACPDEIDLFVGLMSEMPIRGGLLGASAATIVAKQFRDLKFADRFYFETDDPLIKFTPEQLDSIRNVTMSRILADNLVVHRIQTFAFFINNLDLNPLVEPNRLSQLNMTLWFD